MRPSKFEARPIYDRSPCFEPTDAGCSNAIGCVNLSTDNSNCGACGNVCEAGTHCAAPAGASGRCVPNQPDGW